MSKSLPVRDPFELLNEHVNVSRETFSKLSIYHDLLLKWQRKINLISPDTVANSWERHFLDSLQLLKHIPSTHGNIIDIGTGAGFPGMALAVAGIDNIHLIESDAKKVTFLKNVSRETFSPVSVLHGRMENIQLENVHIILSRACSNLTQLLELASKNVSRETFCLFHKGKNWAKEVEDANKSWEFDLTTIPSVTDSSGMIVKLSTIYRRAS